MTTPDLDFDGFCSTLDAKGFQKDQIHIDESGTLYDGKGPTYVADTKMLPVILGYEEADFEVRGQLGQGGMGIVYLARQRGLMRDVAVKGNKESKSRNLAGELLSEGLVTGQLEHPSIVPTYALGKNGQGEVFLVMKRIEGSSWETLLKEEAPHSDDILLEKHLRILLEVCKGISFAHEKGVVHRDLKPQNIMLGTFGEVYILDWGLALSIKPQGIVGVINETERQGISGTPAYMAPEMTMSDSRIDRRTDVYQLGAVLFELLTGRPPHDRGDILRGLYEAYRSKVALPANTPAEIKSICLKALSRAPEDRFENVKAFADAIEAFLSHSSARHLEKLAITGLKQLENPEGIDDDDVQRTFVQVDFGLKQAEKVWPESETLPVNQRRASLAMARYELSRGHFETARRHAGKQDLPEDLKTEFALAQKKAAQVEQTLFDQDARVGTKARATLLFCFGVLWCAYQFVLAYLRADAPVATDPLRQAMSVGAFLALAIVVIVHRRQSLIRNKASLVYAFAVTIFLATGVVSWALAWACDAPPLVVSVYTHLAMTSMQLMLTIHDRRYWPGVFYLLGCFGFLLPNHILQLDGISVLLGVSGTGLAHFWSLRYPEGLFFRSSWVLDAEKFGIE